MIKEWIEKIRKNLVGLVLIFVIGNTFGGIGAYYTIAQDCSIMGMFRIGMTPYSCKRLAP
jgi:hypothetical protein